MKKNVISRLAVLVLTAAMVLGLAACGGSPNYNTEPHTLNTNTDQTEFTIMGAQSALSPGYTDNVVLNELMDETGIHITWNTMSDSLSEQVNIRIAGDIMPDAFMGVGFNNYALSMHGEDGAFIDLAPYITPEIMPNLYQILEDNPRIRAAITMEDGGIYGLPAGEQMGTAGVGKEKDYSIFSIPQFSMINKAWLDELGLEVPTTLDELHDVLVAFKENDMSHTYYGNDPGTTLPMSTGFDQWCWGQNVFYAGFGFTNWPNDVCADLTLWEDGTVGFVSTTQNYRDAVTYFHNWYAEGLMDVEMFSQSDTQLISKCSQGYVGVSTWWEVDELMGDYADDYVYLPILTGPAGTPYEGTSNVTLRTGGATNGGQLSITSACQSPINLLKFFDKWYDGETVMQLQYGPIGVYFNDKDENGVWNSITEEESQKRFGKGAGELKSENEVAGPKLILSKYYLENFNMEDRAIQRLNDLYDYWLPQVGCDAVYPLDCVFTGDELDTIDRYKPDFESALSEQEGLWLRDGGPTDEEWQAYIDHLNDKCGMQELLDVYTAAYGRYAAAQ